jgi:hypothetical protein
MKNEQFGIEATKAWSNVQFKELTDEEILDCFTKIDPSEECWICDEQIIEFAKAILIKAQEK